MSIYLIKHQAIKTCWEGGGIAPHILIAGTHWIGSRVGPRAGLGVVAKRKFPVTAPAGHRTTVVEARSLVSKLTEQSSSPISINSFRVQFYRLPSRFYSVANLTFLNFYLHPQKAEYRFRADVVLLLSTSESKVVPVLFQVSTTP